MFDMFLSQNNTSLPIINYNASNNTTVLPMSQTAIILWFTFSILISLFGIGMAALMLAAIPFHRHLRSKSGILVNNLLVVQLVNCILTPSTYILAFMSSRNALPQNVNCPLLMSILPVYVEPWASAFLAINRFTALMFPHGYKTWMSKRLTILMVTGSWVLGYLFNVLYYLHFTGRVQIVRPQGLCTANATPLDIRFLSLFSYFTTAVPYGLVAFATFIIVCNVLYDKYLHKKVPLSSGVVGVESQPNKNIKARLRRRFMVVRILFASALIHCISFIPFGLFTTFYRAEVARYILLFYWSRTLYVGGFAIDPFLILILSKDFQLGVKALLRFCRTTRKSTEENIALRSRHSAAAGTETAYGDQHLSDIATAGSAERPK